MDAGAGLTFKVRLEAADYLGDELVLDGPERYALGHAEEYLDAVGVRLGQEVEFRREQPCEQRGQGDQRCDPRTAAPRCTRQAGNCRRHFLPKVLESIDCCLVFPKVITRDGQDSYRSNH